MAAVVVARDDDDAARLAGATAYGLGLSVWSASTERAVALAGAGHDGRGLHQLGRRVRRARAVRRDEAVGLRP